MVGSIFTVGVQIQKEAAAVGSAADRRTGHAAAGCPGRLVGQVRHDRGRLGGELFRPRDPRVGRPRRRPHCGPGMRPARPRATWPFGAIGPSSFASAKAYALVVDALLEQRESGGRDGAAGAVAQPGRQIPLVEEDYSFHDLALDWMQDLWDDGEDGHAVSIGRGGQPHRPGSLGAGAEVPRLPGSQRRGAIGKCPISNSARTNQAARRGR